MARPKAASFDVQRGAIRDAAARLFAEKGYASASIAEIAAATGAGEEAAKSRLRYAMNKLREAIRDE